LQILKYLASDPKENQFKSEMSTHASNAQLIAQTKSLYEKSVGHTENYNTADHYDELNVLPEKTHITSNSKFKSLFTNNSRCH